MDGHIANDTKFSSPMPAIGLYIAVATLVCLILMLCDIFNAIHQKKPWIPCQFFVFNSFTLTLLSIATKLPSDLTTSMPSACDQLSKLCGTSFMCISIAFFRPSTVKMNQSELSANLAALTVMVITVVVNVSLQLSTGAIFLFKLEHVLTLLLMLLLLGVMGSFRFTFPDFFTEPFRKSLQRMPRNVHTLKRCYIHSYITNPQLMLCRFSHSATIGILCTICFAVLSEAAIRAYILDQGLKGGSDYKWSIWVVVGLQILALLVGTLAIVCRCLPLASQTHSFVSLALKRNTVLECYNIFLLTHRNWSLYFKTLNHSRMIFRIFRILEYILNLLLILMRIWADCVNKLTLIAIRVVGDCFAWAIGKVGIIGFSFSKWKGEDANYNDDDQTLVMLKKEFDDNGLDKDISLIPNFYCEYLIRKSVMDMELCIKKHSKHPMHSLLKFLKKSACDGSMELLKQISKSSDELLLLVCLVRIADSLVPSFRAVSLASALDQAFEIVVFVHEKTKPTSASKTMKINVAKDIWMSKSINSHWFQTDIIKHLKKGGFPNHIRNHLARLVDKYLMNFVIHEVSDIINIIGEPRVNIIGGTDGQIEELYDHIEQLFVELLRSFIDKFPDVIFNSFDESIPAVEFRKSVKMSMKLVARFILQDAESLRFANNSFSSFMTTDTAENENEPVGDTSFGNEAISDANVIKADGTHVASIETV